MKIVQKGKINPKALEIQRDLQPFEEAKRVTMKRLNFLIAYLEENHSSIKDELLLSLTEKYTKLAHKDYIKTKKVDFSDFEKLNEYSELAEKFLNYFLNLLKVPENKDWQNERITVTNKEYLQGFLFPRYYKFQIIDEALGREKARKFYMKYITAYLVDQQKNLENAYEDIASMYEARIDSNPNPPSEWEIYMGLISDGKYFYRNNNCTWIDSMKDLPDSELKYFTCCYGDYESVKRNNKNFILTMEHTIAQGDPYCSRVIHDTRVDWNLTHPPKNFWDDMKPSED